MTHLPDWTSGDMIDVSTLEFGEGIAVLEKTLEALESILA
ncbi:hypothetical protein ATL42_2942 [Sanguibacter antarcticus]|uniref:Uncharacterized protein n=1 Tax=Sanguibacter antarcticus TaxID=372484 RepID=A0A2A9E9W5_9MICO|nr:hypothetical protein ATL42_2942 [Sanguibacter antarcticus]